MYWTSLFNKTGFIFDKKKKIENSRCFSSEVLVAYDGGATETNVHVCILKKTKKKGFLIIESRFILTLNLPFISPSLKKNCSLIENDVIACGR